MTPVRVGSILIGSNNDRFPIIAGPCVVESYDVLAEVAGTLKELSKQYPVDFIFKSSYRKANRTSGGSFTGIGDEKALELIGKIRTEFGFPTLTDIHLPEEAAIAAKYCDILQIPAFLARQTELLVAAAKTGHVVNIKKGQFMSPEDMQYAKEKIGNDKILFTERGTFFGYGDLVVDFRSLAKMRGYGSPVIFDSTHSVQRPSQAGKSGGDRSQIIPLARAAAAYGVDG